MASNETAKEFSNKNQDGALENENYNSKLDFFSEEFDPLFALRTSALTTPVQNAPIYDNLNKYKSVVEDKQEEKKERKAKNIEECAIERRWLPHQLPIQNTRNRVCKNVFSKMDEVVGPLKLLKTCKDKRYRIKVWTRHSHDIRGYCLAYVVAFDKHWNLALEDVDEVWTRRKKRKVPALDTANVAPLKVKPKVLPPTVTIISSTKTTETCSRHVSQLLVRGEHIAYIVVLSNNK